MLTSIVNRNKPQETGQGLNQKVSSQVRALLYRPTCSVALPVYRADLNHLVTTAEHGNAVPPPSLVLGRPYRKAGQRRHSLGKTEEAKAGGNTSDMPTSVWSEMARTYVEPPSNGKSK